MNYATWSTIEKTSESFDEENTDVELSSVVCFQSVAYSPNVL